MKIFQSFGGSLVLQPIDGAPADSLPVVLKPSDRVIAMCHEGWNRSQTVCQCVKSIKRCFPAFQSPVV